MSDYPADWPGLAASEDMLAQRPKLVGRWRACIEAWPECVDGGYDPRCCRFPKVCSCDVYDDVNADLRYVVQYTADNPPPWINRYKSGPDQWPGGGRRERER